jgi:hypothetical protein
MATSRSRIPWMSLLLLGALVAAVFALRDEFPDLQDAEGPLPALPEQVSSCPENLTALGQAYREWRRDHPGEEPRAGPGFWIGLRREHRIPMGHEDVLICPADPVVIYPSSPDQRMRYDAVDPDDPHDFLGMVSYAFRDTTRFPLAADPAPDPIIGACRCGSDGRTPHHGGGLYVLYASGRVTFLSWKDAGLTPFEDVLVGPGSPHDELSKLLIGQ